MSDLMQFTPKGMALVGAVLSMARRQGRSEMDDGIWNGVCAPTIHGNPQIVDQWHAWCVEHGVGLGSEQAQDRIADMIEAVNR